MKRIRSYFKGVNQEARRVRWPHKKQLWTAVGVVCVITIVSALVILFEDWITVQILKGFETNMPSSTNSSGGGGGESITPAIRIITTFIGGLFR
jgi:preprotein translocase SecE subunit